LTFQLVIQKFGHLLGKALLKFEGAGAASKKNQLVLRQYSA
jgi:hypothetical protein